MSLRNFLKHVMSFLLVIAPAYSVQANAQDAELPNAEEEEQESTESSKEEAEATPVTPAPKESVSGKTVPSVEATLSPMSKKLQSRLLIGTSLGWTVFKISGAEWNVPGSSTVYASWRRSPKADGKLYITGRYAPFAGTMKYNDVFYDATAHGFLGGVTWITPLMVKTAALKAGVETGYLMVYAKPQSGDVGDSKTRSGKFVVGFTSQLSWTVLEKVEVGPFFNLYFGGASIAQTGASTSFVF